MIRTITYTLVAALVVAPTVASAQQTGPTPLPSQKSQQVQLKNVELAKNGTLAGRYVTTAGQPVANVKIAVTQGDRTSGTMTDRDGRFQFEGINPGRAFFHVGSEVYAAQVWKQGTAPPKSLKTVALVEPSKDATVRGQNGPFGGLRTLPPGNKALLGLSAIGAAAVAIAVAADNDDDAS